MTSIKKDLEILGELTKNCRQTNKNIAKKVKLSEQVVGNRIKAMQEKEIIDHFHVKTNPSILGYIHAKIYLRFHNFTTTDENKLIQELKNEKRVFWLASLRGKYDLVISIYMHNLGELTDVFEKLLLKYQKNILNKNILVLEQAYTFSNNDISQEHEETIYTTGKEKKAELTELDKKILEILNKQGRKKLIDIAQELNSNSDTINYRLKKLKEQKIITGFSTKINFEKLNQNYYIIFLKTQATKQKHALIKAISAQNKNIKIYIKTIGEHDTELEIITTSTKEIDNIITTLKNKLTEELKDYEIIEVTKEHTLNYYP